MPDPIMPGPSSVWILTTPLDAAVPFNVRSSFPENTEKTPCRGRNACVSSLCQCR
jgi:hypothetical protein